MQTWIEFEQLQKKIDDFRLGPINLTIEPGTITALVGNNGSGKSTLLKLIMNLSKPDKGTIKLCGTSVSGEDESWKTQIAYQPQTALGYNAFTGEVLKEMVSRWYPNWDDALFMKMVQEFDVPLNKRFGKLSQGSQQKLILALTIARNAPILILDEPTSFMDIPSKKILIDLLVDWMEQGNRAIIIASHQAEDIRKLADYLVILNNGHMLGTFEKEELTEDYKRYWINDKLPIRAIPGEVFREHNNIVSSHPEAIEQFLSDHHIQWTNRTAVELDEVITLLLTKDEKGKQEGGVRN